MSCGTGAGAAIRACIPIFSWATTTGRQYAPRWIRLGTTAGSLRKWRHATGLLPTSNSSIQQQPWTVSLRAGSKDAHLTPGVPGCLCGGGPQPRRISRWGLAHRPWLRLPLAGVPGRVPFRDGRQQDTARSGTRNSRRGHIEQAHGRHRETAPRQRRGGTAGVGGWTQAARDRIPLRPLCGFHLAGACPNPGVLPTATRSPDGRCGDCDICSSACRVAAWRTHPAGIASRCGAACRGSRRPPLGNKCSRMDACARGRWLAIWTWSQLNAKCERPDLILTDLRDDLVDSTFQPRRGRRYVQCARLGAGLNVDCSHSPYCVQDGSAQKVSWAAHSKSQPRIGAGNHDAVFVRNSRHQTYCVTATGSDSLTVGLQEYLVRFSRGLLLVCVGLARLDSHRFQYARFVWHVPPDERGMAQLRIRRKGEPGLPEAVTLPLGQQLRGTGWASSPQ